MPDQRTERVVTLLAARWNLPPYLAHFLHDMTLGASPAAGLASRAHVSKASAQTYASRILKALNVDSKAAAVDLARSEIRAAATPAGEADLIDVIRELLSSGQFASAAPWLARLEMAAQAGTVSSRGTATMHLLLAELLGEQGHLVEARRHAVRAYDLAHEIHDQATEIAAWVMVSIQISRGYDDASAMKLIRALPSDSIPDARVRLTRDALEAAFTWWVGDRPDMPGVRSVARRIEEDPTSNGVELALFTQGLDAIGGGKRLALDGLWSPKRPITSQEESLRRDLISWRADAFPASSAYANLLDALNVTKEAIMEDADAATVRRLAKKGKSVATRVGAVRLAVVFDKYTPDLA